MKVVLILRHAKSSWKEAGMADHDRPLNDRGKRDAPRMGKLLVEQSLVPDCVLASTAKRARKTARLVAQACDFDGTLELVDDLYLAEPNAYLDQLAQLPDSVNRALVVGHNPGLEHLLLVLTGQLEALPTAALAQVELPIERWPQIAGTQGQLAGLWLPRELDASEH